MRNFEFFQIRKRKNLCLKLLIIKIKERNMCYNYVLQNVVNIYSFKFLIEKIIECMKLYLLCMASNVSWYEAIDKSTFKKYIYAALPRTISFYSISTIIYKESSFRYICRKSIWLLFFFLKTRYENKIKW